jgi:hypothetical protein
VNIPLGDSWSFYDGLLFGAGWWSIATWLSVVVGFGIPFVVAGLGRPGTRRDVTMFFLVGFGPVGAVLLFQLLLAVADPDPGCTQECWGRLGLAWVVGVALVMWELGVFFGWVRRVVRERNRAAYLPE